jgi:hypothetical protein
MTSKAGLFQILQLLRPFLLAILYMVLMLDSAHAMDAKHSMLTLQ